ncbi:MAG TPA: sigma-54 dependent transcriptional regulator [Candidatus Polarisedimenticolia bacterium]|nr:sigma-54 dependent transcriptional regulator [Candidatus Polarisedimenticolia bacterium]
MNQKANVLLVDQDPDSTRMAVEILGRAGHRVVAVDRASLGLERLRTQGYDLAIVGLRLPDGEGVDLLERFKAISPETPVALVASDPDVDQAILALRKGAYDFLRRPLAEVELLALADKAAHIKQIGYERRRTAEELQSEKVKNFELRRNLQSQYAFGAILGKSPKMKQIHDVLQEVTGTDSTVLIMGESGTGKGLLARILHYNSLRAEGPFVEANCAVYSEGILHSELFGHEKGAFTGALKQKKGRFELAHTGTIFLDEIGDLSPATQLMLLRFLQERRFERVGGEETLEVDVRVIAATNKNLQEGMEKGSFRNDLFYRLNVIPIHIAPLRERVEDIPILGMEFLDRMSKKVGKPMRGFSSAAMEAMTRYSWPGNVRELENVLERTVVLAKGDLIEPSDLPPNLRDGSVQGADVKLSLYENERLYILKTLAECNWNKKLAASVLGINRSSLYSKLKRYEIGKDVSVN